MRDEVIDEEVTQFCSLGWVDRQPLVRDQVLYR